MSEPVISIILRTYNSEVSIVDAIESIVQQKIAPVKYEILVVDGGSTDKTTELLRSYHDRIHFITQDVPGHVHAINIGLHAARGEYFTLLDSDDILEPDFLFLTFEFLEKKKDDAFVYTDYYECDVQTGKRKIVSLEGRLFHSIAGGILWRRYIVDVMGGYDEQLFFPEYDLLIKVMQHYQGGYIPRPLYCYNRRRGSLTMNKKFVQRGKQQLVDRYGDISVIQQIREY